MTHQNFFEDVPIGMAQVSLQGRLLAANLRFCEIVGYTRAELSSMTFQDITHPDDLLEDLDNVERLIEKGCGSYQMEKRYIRSDGVETWVDLNVSIVVDQKGNPTNFLATVSEINSAKRRENALADLAFIDAVTTLPNRNYFERALDKAISKARRSGHKIGLLFLDLNGFKQINDTFGHEVGDKVLGAVGRRLAERNTRRSLAARLGGDEFVYMVSDIECPRVVKSVAKEIMSVFRDPVKVDGRPLPVSASIGHALFPDHARSAEALLRFADLSMYDGKRVLAKPGRAANRRSVRTARKTRGAG